MTTETQIDRSLRCWFCGEDRTDAFSSEFDCYLHICCLQSESEENPEARIMSSELGYKLLGQTKEEVSDDN